MTPTRARLVGIVVALTTIAAAAPVSTAIAVTPAAPVTIVSAGPDGSPATTLPMPGHAGTITGPTFITDGSTTFTDTRIVVSCGDASLGR
jgi:hypothetical protein